MHNAVMPTTGERIRDARDGLKLSQAQLAEQVGVNQTTVSRWERDELEPGVTDAGKLAKALGEDPCRMFFPECCGEAA